MPNHREKTAAFYDVDGTLIKTNIVHSFAFYALRQPELLKSFLKITQTTLSIPLFVAADVISRKWFNEIFYKMYRGASEDRLVVLAEELFDKAIKPNLYARSKGLIEESRRSGCRQVLVTGALDFTIKPLARYLEVDDVIANRLEFVDGYANGKLTKPFIAGVTKSDVIRKYADENAIDLSQSYAYSDSYSDYPMLTVVGHPTAVNPDFRLRSVARAYHWPMINLS